MRLKLGLCMIHMKHLWLFIGGFSVLLAGCSTPDLSKTVEQTDAHVYEVVDNHWDESLGTRTNYRIDGTVSESALLDMLDDAIARESRVLTLPQAVATATVNNRQYQLEKENLYLAALDYTDIRHLYEPMPFAGGSGEYTKDLTSESTSIYGNAGFNQLLATGAQIGTDISLGWVDIISGDFRSGFSSIASAVITQPLLRGAGRKIALENLTQAEQDTLYQIRTFNRYRKEFVVSIISTYYQTLKLYDRQYKAGDNYIALFEIYEKLEKRAAAGKVAQHELEQARQDKLKAYSALTQTTIDYTLALDEFKKLLAMPIDNNFELDKGELEALRQSVTEEMEMTESEAVKFALEQRLDLANAADQVIDACRKVDVAADAIRAELNLIGIADNTTLDSQTVNKHYNLSLELDLPIDRLFEKNNYRRALITLIQQQRNHQETNDQIVLEVRRSYKQKQEAYERYCIERTASQLAQKRTRDTLLLLKYNRANTRDVLDARDDLLDAQNAETEALIDYAVACLEFYRDTGIMKIKPDGMWEKALPTEIEIATSRQ